MKERYFNSTNISQPYVPYEIYKETKERRRKNGGPPYWGTIIVEPDIIKEDEQTLFNSANYLGTGYRNCYDRRVNSWLWREYYLFSGKFHYGIEIEFRVNSEDFDSEAKAQHEVNLYGPYIGKIPNFFREGIKVVCIKAGNYGWGGGRWIGDLLIHTDRGKEYLNDGIVEEVMIHESAHISLDYIYGHSELGPQWFQAATNDGKYISTYAQDYPDREDIAETFLLILAILYRPSRLSQQDSDIINSTISHRIDFFKSLIDSLNLNMYPIILPNYRTNEPSSEPSLLPSFIPIIKPSVDPSLHPSYSPISNLSFPPTDKPSRPSKKINNSKKNQKKTTKKKTRKTKIPKAKKN